MNAIESVQSVTAATLAEWTEAALALDWSEAYDATKDVDGEITDETSDVGDVIEAAYWYAVHCHGGQGSDEYRLQCELGEIFTPGCSSNGPEPETAAHDMYTALCSAAGCDSE